MISILIADDENLFREALATLLDLHPDMQIVARAADGAAAVELAAEHQPDVALLDLEMPGLDGIETATRMLAARPEQRIILLTRHARPGVLRRALRAGIRGFLSKAVDPDLLAEVIERVHSGDRFVDAETTTRAMIDDCPLTDRELDVLRATRDGYSVREIAAQLHLSSGTVRNYLSSAMQKTATASRHQAARIASQRDWL